jgi:DNA-binding NarL/FixJ family response regulator
VAGQRRLAHEQLIEGAELAQRCGAVPLADRARKELRVLGSRPRRLMFSGLESLTASELRVATMAAGGLTNRQIAQDLFVTSKTVENHLSRAYSKLHITSRAKLRESLVEDLRSAAAGS